MTKSFFAYVTVKSIVFICRDRHGFRAMLIYLGVIVHSLSLSIKGTSIARLGKCELEDGRFDLEIERTPAVPVSERDVIGTAKLREVGDFPPQIYS